MPAATRRSRDHERVSVAACLKAAAVQPSATVVAVAAGGIVRRVHVANEKAGEM
jgi:hypothetical protein